MVDVVDAHLLVIHHLPAQRKLIAHTVGKGQGLGYPTGIQREQMSELKTPQICAVQEYFGELALNQPVTKNNILNSTQQS